MRTGVYEMDGHLIHEEFVDESGIDEKSKAKPSCGSQCNADAYQSGKESMPHSGSPSNSEPSSRNSSAASSLNISSDRQPVSPASQADIEENSGESSDNDHLRNAEKIRLELILGPVGSGKSTELGRRLRRKKIYKKVFAVSTTADTRYGDTGIITHDGLVTPCFRVTRLSEVIQNPDYQNAEVIGIDEANFFPDLPEFIREQLDITSKTFIVSGLDADRHKKPFGRVLELIPDADQKDFLKALCKRCADGTEAPFSIEVVAFEGQVKVGGADSFEAVCRRHYDSIRYCQRVDQLKKSHLGIQIEKIVLIDN